MTNTATAPEQAPPISKAEILRALAHAADEGLPVASMHMHVTSYGSELVIGLDNNDTDGLSRWAAYLGAPVVVDPGRRGSDAHSWRQHRVGTTLYDRPVHEIVRWHGWIFEVWTAVTITPDAADSTAVEINA